ncbi:DUF4132 domain-containing protein [Massilia sp. CCM 8733]|uniref:DUF4132 domain-containing protein n=1 Tax=Massilia mucilaginosa TaxID=2609282 RepID=A0ABX0NP51_9BURK|nr:DUF4132 domain-containing protein [Massilia mucilaginosa]NHZ88577.1 DUF4132 domain-containing protein [Massilia mucilaginosa]
MRRFELSDDVSSKFWQVDQVGNDLHIGFGKIGTAGQRQCKNYADDTKAGAAMEKLIRKKTVKGYAETAGGETVAVAAIAPIPAPAASMVASTPAPPEAAGSAILPPELAAHALPSRRHPGPPPSADADARWRLYLARVREHCELRPRSQGSIYHAAVNEALARIAKGERRGSPASDAILLATESVIGARPQFARDNAFIDVLVADKGLPYAMEIVLRRQSFVITYDSIDGKGFYQIHDPGTWDDAFFGDTELALRAHLAHAPQEVWEECVRIARYAAPGLDRRRRPLLAALLPDAPGLADELALMLPPYRENQSMYWSDNDGWLLLYATAPEALDALRAWPYRPMTSFHESLSAVACAVQDRGAGAFEALREGVGKEAAAHGLACIGTAPSMTVLALGCDQSQTPFTQLCAAAQRWPDLAMTVLSQLIAKDHCGPARARQALASIMPVHAARAAALKPLLPAPAWKVLSVAAAQFVALRDCADTSELPAVLAEPPWQAPARKEAPPFALAPLPLAPIATWSEEERQQLRDEWRYFLGFMSTSPEALAQAVDAVAAADTDGSLARWVDCLLPDRAFQGRTLEILALPAPVNARVWNALAAMGMDHPGQAIAKLGLAAIPGLIEVCIRTPGQHIGYALYFGAVELALPVARAYATLKARGLLATARAWLLRHPEHAACGLIAVALGQPGPERDHARRALRLLAAAGQRDLLLTVAGRYGQVDVRAALGIVLDESPLQLYPAKIGKLPPFWTPLVWTRPLLAGSGKALPDAVLDAVGIMLRFPHSEGVYAGVTQLKQVCTPASLADFAWELFRAWTEDGARPKEDWAFHALGLLGNDDTARRLTPLLRAWPGEKLHTRAVAGLDILAMIGTDAALLHLNGIAQKLKFKALQDRAQEKIAAIAEVRGLSAEELEDRLAPDLGLDEQGTLLLDFGPRQFRVGFDEALKPYLRDEGGARLADLPKPKQSDDPELSAAAVERYKLLKKDARALAAQQMRRLESAMCAQRRWPRQVFLDFLAGHPLLRHLVQRLVWGVYGSGGALLACFRVSVDGAFTDAGDDSFTLPQDDILVGIPHAVDLPPAMAAAFGQLFADYQLLQPFAQLGRDTYRLGADEQGLHALERWRKIVPTGSVLGLVNQGWRRGQAWDGGAINELSKMLGGGYMAELTISPGITAGMANESEEQRLDQLVVRRGDAADRMGASVALSSLDAAMLSELIREMERLCTVDGARAM